MNASDIPRLSPNKRRRLDFHDAIIRVSSHPNKLRCLLKAYPCALIPRPVKDRLVELEQQRREDQETQAMLRASLSIQRHELGIQRHELDVSNGRIATLEEQQADLQRQVRTLQRYW